MGHWWLNATENGQSKHDECFGRVLLGTLVAGSAEGKWDETRADSTIQVLVQEATPCVKTDHFLCN